MSDRDCSDVYYFLGILLQIVTYMYLFSPLLFSINRVIVIERTLIEQVAFVTGTKLLQADGSLRRACHLNRYQSVMHVKQPLRDL